MIGYDFFVSIYKKLIEKTNREEKIKKNSYSAGVNTLELPAHIEKGTKLDSDNEN